ncbi:nitroreductase [Planomicrobium sp. YIM 101495]|uniref:nitroreductase family protein n=1 Tax=Planomicrobium sp. YIM 101495 TaxID=2665160 RepID=UPI0012B7C684|nr:nitroreductase [Planomicrobium sp. YIM 101495]MTD31376.1 nitroreductase [Planomicrobium sp. YIM 101495]
MKNPIDQAIMSRRSIKKFKPAPVATEEIIELLNVAKWAPNHKVNEPWRFQLYTGDGKEKFVQAYVDAMPKVDGATPQKVLNKANYFRDIPVHLVVIMPEDPRQRRWDEDYGAVASMLQNFQLAAWERGIGMIWRSNDWIYDPVFREAIGVKPGEKIVATMMIGYAAHVPEKRERTDVREKMVVIDK